MSMKDVAMAARRTSRALSWPRIPCDAVAPMVESQSNRQSQEQGGHPRPPAAFGGHPGGPYGCSVAAQPPPLRGTPLSGGAGRSAPIRPGALLREAPTRMSNLIATR